MIKPSEDLIDTSKKKLRQKNNEIKIDGNPIIKGIGLFDHVKHIRSIQTPDYFKTLTDLDKKSFNHFMILRALSFNPNLLGVVSFLLKYFDKIPSPQFYQLLITWIQPDEKFYPWIKSSQKTINPTLLSLIVKYFDVSKKEADDYAKILFSTESGKKELVELCRNFGLETKDIEKIMNGKEENNNNDYRN